MTGLQVAGDPPARAPRPCQHRRVSRTIVAAGEIEIRGDRGRQHTSGWSRVVRTTKCVDCGKVLARETT